MREREKSGELEREEEEINTQIMTLHNEIQKLKMRNAALEAR